MTSHDRSLFEANPAWDTHEAPAVSFEFFPPRTEALRAQLYSAIETLAPLAPRFVSVTYGAGGSTRAQTLDVACHIARTAQLPVAAHLTCVDASRDDVDEVAASFWAAGIRHIVAVRGDAGVPGAPFHPHPLGYRSAAEMVAGLRRVAPFEISVAAYPEGHPQARNLAADIDDLWRKIDAGAARAITQFFFSPDIFLRFRDRAASLGIDAEIVPGILPIGNVVQTRRFALQCGATISPAIDRLIDGLDAQPATRHLVAATISADLCLRLRRAGVRQFHFYTLNRAELSHAMCHVLDVRPQEQDHEQCYVA